MASEYSVNIKLNTAQVKRDLKTIGDGISNLGRKTTGSKKRILTTDADDQLLRDLGIKTRKFARTINPILNKADKVAAKGGMLALPDSKMLNAQLKGIKRLETSADIAAKHTERKARAEERSAKFATASMKANQASAKAGVAHARKLARMTGDTGFTAAQFGPQLPMQGPRMFGQAFDPTGGSSALNFSRSGRLLQGPAGSSPNTFGNLRRRFGPRRGFDFGSAAISGGFPLLFGQGPGVAAAGALGGGIGGMFGQMGGFAGGIAATAAVQSIQNAVTAVSQLGQALSPITPNIQALSQSLGLVGTQEQKRLELIEEVRGKQAAFNAAVDEMRRVIGDEATEKLREFGESTRLIGSEFSIAMTKMQSALAGLFGAVDRFLGLTRGAERSQRNRAIAGSDDPEIVRRREEIERLQNTTGGGRSGAKNRQDRIKTLKAELDELGKQEVVVNNIATRRQNLNLIESSAGKKLRQENELLQAKLDGNFEEVQLAQQLDAEIQKRLDKGMGIMEIDIEAISNAIELNNKLEKQVELSEKIGSNFEQIGESIASGVSDNLTAAILQTKTLGDAAKSILNDLANTLVKLGVNTILKGIAPGFFGSLTGLGFARGGRPPTGRPSIVGERGPELFVPRRSGTIIPNDKLGGGGSTNISVNVDASGSSVEGDEQQSKELGKAISAAIQSELLKQRRPGGLLR